MVKFGVSRTIFSGRQKGFHLAYPLFVGVWSIFQPRQEWYCFPWFRIDINDISPVQRFSGLSIRVDIVAE